MIKVKNCLLNLNNGFAFHHSVQWPKTIIKTMCIAGAKTEGSQTGEKSKLSGEAASGRLCQNLGVSILMWVLQERERTGPSTKRHTRATIPHRQVALGLAVWVTDGAHILSFANILSYKIKRQRKRKFMFINFSHICFQILSSIFILHPLPSFRYKERWRKEKRIGGNARSHGDTKGWSGSWGGKGKARR